MRAAEDVERSAIGGLAEVARTFRGYFLGRLDEIKARWAEKGEVLSNDRVLRTRN